MLTEKQTRTIVKNFSALGAPPSYGFLAFLMLVLGTHLLFKWMAIGLLVSYIIGPSMRLIWYKERPEKREYTNLLGKIDSSSFPSMHSYRAAMMMLFFTAYYNNIYVFALFILLAGIIMISRHYLKDHFAIDIVVGAILGLLTSYFIILLV